MDEQSLFAAALEHESEAARRAFLDEACTDPAIRARLDKLLDLRARASGFLEEPAGGLPAELLPADASCEEIGQTIGPYKLVERIGEGGMGVVYMAAQKSPVKRKVALKIIKPGMDTRQVVARFEAERQALAMMDHPNIAHVLDAGSTESGRPYFVMELVRGIPITDFCRQEATGLDKRLKLFVDIAHAVQHAHQKGIIHRDIKPSNVMVTLHDGDPVVKMIDFGVAKAMNQQLTERTVYTNYAQMIGTPLYMSPEQAELSGLDVDTRSDIYSLGVLLYELLTETTPFEKSRLHEVGYDEMRRIIREEDPPMPSTRVSTLGRELETITDRRKTDARRVSQQLRGDLDWIVIKALDKKRGRRYQTAKDFADDVIRYLEGEPVEACPPSVLYRARKSLAKHRGLVTTAAAIALLMVLGTAVSTVFAVRAMRAESRAAAAQTDAEAISDFLTRELLGQASPYQNPNRDLRLRQVLDRASQKIEGHFDKQPLVEAEIHLTLGQTYRHLGEYETATRHLQRALDLRGQHLGHGDRGTLRCAFELAIVRLFSGSDKTTGDTFQDVLDRQRRTLGDNHRDALITMGWLAYCRALQRRFDEAEPLFKKANAGLARVLGPDHPDTLDCLDATARMYQYQGRYAEAAGLQTRLLRSRRQVLGDKHPQVSDTISALAAAKLAQGKTSEGLKLYEQAVGNRRRGQGGQHPATFRDTRQMATTLYNAHQHQAAERLYLDNLKAEREQFGIDDERTLLTMAHLASFYKALARYRDAERLLRQVLESRRRVLGDNNDDTTNAKRALASVLVIQKQFDDALKLQAEIVETTTHLHGAYDKRTSKAVRAYGHGLQQAGRYGAATRLTVNRLADVTAHFGEDHPEVLKLKLRLAFTHNQHRKLMEAEPLFRELWESKAFGDDDPETLRAGNQLAYVLRQTGRAREAEPLCRRVLEQRVLVFGENHIDTAYSIHNLARICESLGRIDEQSDLLVRLARIRCKVCGSVHNDTLKAFGALLELAERLDEEGEGQAALRLHQRTERLAAELLKTNQAVTTDGQFALAEVRLRLNHLEEAIEGFKAVVAARRQAHGEIDPRTITAIDRLATAYATGDRYEDALPILRNVSKLKARLYGSTDPQTVDSLIRLLDVCKELKRPDEADELVQELVDRIGVHHRRIFEARLIQAETHIRAGRFPTAREILSRVWHEPGDDLAADDELRIRAGSLLAEGLRANHQPVEALPLARQVLTIQKRVRGENSSPAASTYRLLGMIYRDLGEPADCIQSYESAFRIRVGHYGTGDPLTRQVIGDLTSYAGKTHARGDFATAWRLYKAVLPMSVKSRGDTHPTTMSISGRLADSYGKVGMYEEAYEEHRRNVELRRRPGVQDDPPYWHLMGAAGALVKLKRFDEAESLIDECLRHAAQHDPDHPAVAGCLGHRGEILVARKQYDEAETVLLRGHEILAKGEHRNRDLYQLSVSRLVDLYESTNRGELAKEWADRLNDADADSGAP